MNAPFGLTGLWLRHGARRPKTVVATAVALLCVAYAAAKIVMAAWPESANYRNLIDDERIAALDQRFAELKDETVFFGDSHAAFLAQTERFCGRPVLDAAVSGINVTAYRALLDRLATPRSAPLGILSIGTNSARSKLLPRDLSIFQLHAEAIMDRLASRTRRLIVLAIPPVADFAMPGFDRSALKDYTETLRDLCRLPNCSFLDPYAADRSSDAVVAKAQTTQPDGVHAADYGKIRTDIAKVACP